MPVHVDFLQQVFEIGNGDDPFITVWTDTTHDTEDARQQAALRRRALLDELAGQGAEPDELTGVDGAVAPAPLAGDQSQLVVCAGGRVLLSDHLTVRPGGSIARRSTLPHLMPWLVARDRSGHQPYLLVLIDRNGADIRVRATAGQRDTVEVDTDLYPVEKNAPGGWSQRRYQRAAEENWEHTAKQVAAAVEDLRRAHRPDAVILSGDPRARAVLLDVLSPASRALVVQLGSLGRASGVSEESLAADVELVLARHRHGTVDQVARSYEFARGRARATDGLERTMTALARGAVDTLLVSEVGDDGVTAWVGPEPLALGLRREDAAALVTQPDGLRQERADAAMVRALVATDGQFVSVEPDRLALRDGVGAILRHPVPAGPGRS